MFHRERRQILNRSARGLRRRDARSARAARRRDRRVFARVYWLKSLFRFVRNRITETGGFSGSPHFLFVLEVDVNPHLRNQGWGHQSASELSTAHFAVREFSSKPAP